MTEVQQPEAPQEALPLHLRDPQYCDIVHNTVIGIHYVSRVRLAKLARDDPFRNQCLIWCEYFAETTLMMVSIAGNFVYDRDARIDAENLRVNVSRPTLVSKRLKEWFDRVKVKVRSNKPKAIGAGHQGNPPHRLGRNSLFRATVVFAGDFHTLGNHEREAARNYRHVLDELMLGENGELLPLHRRFQVYKAHLEAQARYCRAAVDHFYVQRLRARDNITQRVMLYREASRAIVNFRPLAAELEALSAYISRFEEATAAFPIKRIVDQSYLTALFQFMSMQSSQVFDPVRAGLLIYNSNPPEWSLEYQFVGRNTEDWE